MRPDLELVRDPRLERHVATVRAQLSPTAVALATRTADALDWRALGPPDHPQWTTRLIQQVRSRVAPAAYTLGLRRDTDIEALVFLVLMEAAQSAREDLKAIMAGVKSINRAKEKLHELLLAMAAESEEAGERPSR